ncbi:MAG: DMT family transporter [Thermomicrobiales bacterium]
MRVVRPSASAAAEQSDPSGLTRYLPELAALTVVVLWASTFIVTKNAFETFSPLAFVGIRFVLMTALALGVLYVRGRKDPARYFQVARDDWSRFVLVGLVGYGVYQLGFNFGLEHSSPFAASLIMAMTPVFALGIATFQGERSTWLVWLGVLVAVAGVVVFLTDKNSGGTVLGTVLMLVASVSSAIYSVTNRPLVRTYPFETVAAITTIAGAVPLVLVSLPQMIDQDWTRPSFWDYLALVYMVILPVYVAYILWNWAINQRGISITGGQLLVPVVSGGFSALFFSESFGLVKIIGGVIALAGLVLMRISARRVTKS